MTVYDTIGFPFLCPYFSLHFFLLSDDFKPQSVDSRRPGNLRVAEDGAVNVSLPVGQVRSGGRGMGGVHPGVSLIRGILSL